MFARYAETAVVTLLLVVSMVVVTWGFLPYLAMTVALGRGVA